jgi:hypothetical protein
MLSLPPAPLIPCPLRHGVLPLRAVPVRRSHRGLPGGEQPQELQVRLRVGVVSVYI